MKEIRCLFSTQGVRIGDHELSNALDQTCYPATAKSVDKYHSLGAGGGKGSLIKANFPQPFVRSFATAPFVRLFATALFLVSFHAFIVSSLS